MDDCEAVRRVTDELKRVTTTIERITGLASRWDGTVALLPDATFLARKLPACSMEVDLQLAGRPERWRTWIHEALHSVSVGYGPDAFQRWRGWEEGVVEQLQRLLRADVLSELGVAIADTVFAAVERSHPFNGYIAALERVRAAFGEEPRDFYLNLLRTPLGDRYGMLAARALRATGPARVERLTALSAARPILERR